VASSRADRAQQLKKAAFLESYRVLGNISRACRDAEINRSTYYDWTEHDEAFSAALNVAREEAIESLEAEARRRAVEGVERETGVYHNGLLIATEVETKYSDTLLIFLLKGLKPEKYRERMDVNHSGIPSVKPVAREFYEAV
jgi:hypothetical protein